VQSLKINYNFLSKLEATWCVHC